MNNTENNAIQTIEEKQESDMFNAPNLDTEGFFERTGNYKNGKPIIHLTQEGKAFASEEFAKIYEEHSGNLPQIREQLLKGYERIKTQTKNAEELQKHRRIYQAMHARLQYRASIELAILELGKDEANNMNLKELLQLRKKFEHYEDYKTMLLDLQERKIAEERRRAQNEIRTLVEESNPQREWYELFSKFRKNFEPYKKAFLKKFAPYIAGTILAMIIRGSSAPIVPTPTHTQSIAKRPQSIAQKAQVGTEGNSLEYAIVHNNESVTTITTPNTTEPKTTNISSQHQTNNDNTIINPDPKQDITPLKKTARVENKQDYDNLIEVTSGTMTVYRSDMLMYRVAYYRLGLNRDLLKDPSKLQSQLDTYNSIEDLYESGLIVNKDYFEKTRIKLEESGINVLDFLKGMLRNKYIIVAPDTELLNKTVGEEHPPQWYVGKTLIIETPDGTKHQAVIMDMLAEKDRQIAEERGFKLDVNPSTYKRLFGIRYHPNNSPMFTDKNENPINHLPEVRIYVIHPDNTTIAMNDSTLEG